MKKNLLSKKIPTILGVLLLLAGIAAGVYFIGREKLSELTAGPTATPKKVYITNIQNNQFTVSWITDEKTIGYIKYGETSKVKNIVRDDRDQRSGEKQSFYLHYLTVKNLQSSKTYYLKIGAGGKLYDNNGQPYTVTTGSTLGPAGEARIVSGKILNQDSAPVQNAIVYLSSTNISSTSSLTDKEGRWAIFLNKARVSDLSSYAVFDPEATILKIEVEGGTQTASAVTTTKNAFPVPDMILGHAPYDFREEFIAEEEEIPVQAEAASQTSSQFSVEPMSTPSATPTTVTIDNPTSGEEINTFRPEIQGKGTPFKVLTIKIESPETHSSTVTIDENGSWSFVPPDDLSTGEHTVYVSYVDESGATKTISRNFVVLAAGTSELPAFIATPSAEASPSAEPSPSPSPSASPSPIPRVSMPSTEAGVPDTGIVVPTFLVFIAGLLMIIFGITTLIVIDKANQTNP